MRAAEDSRAGSLPSRPPASVPVLGPSHLSPSSRLNSPPARFGSAAGCGGRLGGRRRAPPSASSCGSAPRLGLASGSSPFADAAVRLCGSSRPLGFAGCTAPPRLAARAAPSVASRLGRRLGARRRWPRRRGGRLLGASAAAARPAPALGLGRSGLVALGRRLGGGIRLRGLRLGLGLGRRLRPRPGRRRLRPPRPSWASGRCGRGGCGCGPRAPAARRSRGRTPGSRTPAGSCGSSSALGFASSSVA